MCTCADACVCVSVRVSGPLQVELQAAVSLLTWVLGTHRASPLLLRLHADDQPVTASPS